MKRYKLFKAILVFWCLFIGVGAVFGATAMLLRPDGSILQMQALLPYFQVLPFADVLFQNYIFPGIALLVVNGLSNLLAAALLLAKRKLGIVLGAVFGFTLMLWITIQFIIFPANPLSTSYFIFGALQLITGYACYVFYRQVTFKDREYQNIGANGRELVVYFSRLGRTRQIAMETAEKTGAEVFQLKTAELTEGTLGFWWCGRFGMHGWGMELESMPENLSSYDKVTVVSPVWVFSVCAPVREFLRRAAGEIKAADYVLVHFQPAAYNGVMDMMDEVLGVSGGSRRSVSCRLGRFNEMTVKNSDGKAAALK